jgi:hypothetical protein
MQDRYVGALTAIANFLKQSGVDEDIAHKFAELAAAVSDLRLGVIRRAILTPRIASSKNVTRRAALGRWLTDQR